jgi:23S rRNA (pseudouridine1915-N3)-methyltransferase
MRVWIAAVGAKPRAAFEQLAGMYLERMAPYLPGGGKSGVEAPVFRSEESFWTAVEKERARTAPLVVLLDERGKPLGSESFAAWLGRERDAGRQLVIFAVGPANGWQKQATGNKQQGIEAQRIASSGHRPGKDGSSAGAGEVVWLSLGPMTMAHELARVVVCEQVYRALTILAGHPYHRAAGSR